MVTKKHNAGVIVLGCNETDMYGSNCDILCPTICKYNTCHIQQGTCFGCQPGWTGLYCNTKHGHCDKGCDPGYTNRDCSIECSSGYFGMKCRGRCSGNCINNEACDHITGICPRRCMDGYIGRHCNISCQPGYFGTNCSFPCWPHYGLRNVEFTTDVSACTFWIAAFSISLVNNIIFLFAMFLSRRKEIVKLKSTTNEENFSKRSGSKTEQTATTVDPSHYQELKVSQPENTYQTYISSDYHW
uniref:EGF-like domain-containing protein n=1 Tax=Magallana gigas TaxID=29159 RepID=A0A8W8NN71_MAGGI